MTTFSCCMIVKNESKVLARCLDSIADLMDEIVIVDTGSTDNTKAIAAKYTDKIYDFAWADDFSAARNFSFSKATMDYIYAPDADEYLDKENHRQLALVKECMDPSIEIVQMMYHTISENTVLNITDEYRPKLFKRLRTFTWIDPIHETVRLDPVVFDSDIVITHAPSSGHADRDFAIFKKAIVRDGGLSDKVTIMYATELIKKGKPSDLQDAKEFFQRLYEYTSDELIKIDSACVLVRCARLSQDSSTIEALLNKSPLEATTSEIYLDFGLYYMEKKDYEKAINYLSLAANEVPYALDVHTCGDLPLKALCECYEVLLSLTSSTEDKVHYTYELSVCKKRLKEWQPPREDFHT